MSTRGKSADCPAEPFPPVRSGGLSVRLPPPHTPSSEAARVTQTPAPARLLSLATAPPTCSLLCRNLSSPTPAWEQCCHNHQVQIPVGGAASIMTCCAWEVFFLRAAGPYSTSHSTSPQFLPTPSTLISPGSKLSPFFFTPKHSP